jgi:hypothetical protein
MYYHPSDRESVISQLKEKEAYINAILTVPFWNIHSQILGDQYAVVYQAKEEISVEVEN